MPNDTPISEKNKQMEQRLADLLAGRVAASELANFLSQGEGAEVNVPDLLDTFKNPQYSPHSTGIKHLFLGGSPFPQSRGQIQGGNMAALLGGFTNVNSRAGNPMGAALGALVDLIRRKRQQGGRSG